uniref:SCP domain-containing protein n=1 Tax=Ascaris lumbricoides TaxID=6252 RepID=A0A0M3HMB9_ASCLU
NICKFTDEESTKECIDANTIKGAQLCTDNPQLFPDMTIPEIVEYWSTEIDENSGMLSTMEMLAFEEKLEATGGKDSCRNVLKVSYLKSFFFRLLNLILIIFQKL